VRTIVKITIAAIVSLLLAFVMISLASRYRRKSESVSAAKLFEPEYSVGIPTLTPSSSDYWVRYKRNWANVDFSKLPQVASAGKNSKNPMFYMKDPEESSGMTDVPLVPSSVFDVDEYLKGLSFGNIIFNTPEEMKINEKFIVKLILSPDKIKVENVPKTGRVSIDKAKIDRSMESTLVGTGFDIKEVTPSVLATSMIEDTTWMWEVASIKAGDQILCVNLSVKIDLDGEKVSRTIKTFEKTIHVKISPLRSVGDFLLQNWQYIMTSIFIPLLVWYCANKRNKKPVPHVVHPAHHMGHPVPHH
jgi:hypothetical protein